MRNAIREFIEYSADEKSTLWDNAVFVFDTNVLLNLYRYSNNTRIQLIESIEKLKERIWLPYHVALEFCKDRYKVLEEANTRFDSIERNAQKLAEDWSIELRLDKNDSDIKELIDYLEEWIEKKKNKNYQIFDSSDDKVFNKMLSLFDGKTGERFTDEEIKQIEEEGEKRYLSKIPPGYKDNTKVENKYGDLIVWKEILRYAKDNRVDIIFVTHDQKEDWWNISSGKTIGPRVELRKEFLDYTGKMFHMYSMTSFLELFSTDKGKEIDDTTINEVELISDERDNRNTEQTELDYEDTILEKIAVLEERNNKRRMAIDKLLIKKKKGKLTRESEIALRSNIKNISRDEKKIKELNDKLQL